METTDESLIQLTTLYNKFKFHRTVLILCELYFGYTYVVDFPTGSLIYRIIMGGILLAMAILALKAHRKMGILQGRIQKERQQIS
ncbi:hypothetical protein [Anaerotignum sp. MB30-C6]|uniref:hypothetical protein n=1 Tax=Anaerotignum sp. MB30-C6 TaxID=3070814 RepID=UPI0027DE4A85|nr:hypothetical protein [Anaerotignum sp. MB30-C6]WMI79954.1 hypothetical protein RBQ60_08855 [Anaerotignum sp. MB30-C6]